MYRVVFLVSAVLVLSALALDCNQIQDSQIFNGSTIFIPSGSGELQPIPANFNCVYKIEAPANSTGGYFANIKLKNGLKGVNDYILVNDQYGRQHTLNNRTGMGGWPTLYTVVPGAEMTIQVVTKSVYMMSMFSIQVDYFSVQIGPNIQMKTGGEMNFIDVASLRNSDTVVNTVTFIGTEPIALAISIGNHFDLCSDCYVIDGTIGNHTKVYDVADIELQRFTTVSNQITLVAASNQFFGVVLNPKSEAEQFQILNSLATSPDEDNGAGLRTFFPGRLQAYEVVNFDRKGIIMDNLDIDSNVCKAYVVSGPPNNSSKVLLDLSTSPQMPHTFPDLQYFSVVNQNCSFSFYVRSTNN